MEQQELLEGAARYAGLLLAPAEGFGQGLFFAGKKKRFFISFVAHILVFFGDQ